MREFNSTVTMGKRPVKKRGITLCAATAGQMRFADDSKRSDDAKLRSARLMLGGGDDKVCNWYAIRPDFGKPTSI